MRSFVAATFAFVLALAAPSRASGPPQPPREDCPTADPDSSQVTVIFEGAARGVGVRDVVTIAPDGRGDTFASQGITVTLVAKYATGVPAAWIPRQAIVLWASGLCVCPGGNFADEATNIDGRTTFHGTLAGGGFASGLQVYVDGVRVGDVPLRINSPDLNADCAVDGSDLSALAVHLGSRAGEPRYTLAADFNEDGSVDASDLSCLAIFLRSRCAPW